MGLITMTKIPKQKEIKMHNNPRRYGVNTVKKNDF